MLTGAGYLAAIVESSDDAIIGKDLDGKIVSWNKSAERIFGYSAEEIIGKPIAMLFPCDRLGEEDVILDQIKRGEHVDHLKTTRRRKDGMQIPVSITVSPILNADGVVVGASKILRDISARLASERALARSDAEFRASFEGAAVGKMMAEPISGRILRANQAFARMLGYDAEELCGQTIHALTYADDRDIGSEGYRNLVSGASPALALEKRLRRSGGEPLWVRESTMLARSPETGEALFAVISIEDIDARYKAQAALLEAKRGLEDLVEERTAALAQRDLLLREVYHRVKNNLQIVDGLIVMQAREIDDPKAKQALLDLRRRIFALGLVHQQLMGSPDLTTFDVAPFLRELSANLVESSGDQNVNLSVEAHPLRVGLDFAIPLGLIVTELVSNSLKHAQNAGICNVSVLLRPEGDDRIKVIVSDDGGGVTEPFPDSRWKSGFGLEIVRGLVEQLEGTMLVNNKSGTTTEISVKMPERI